MLPLKITRRRDASVDSKQLLRTCVDELSVDQQREFVLMAVQLIIARPQQSSNGIWPYRGRQFLARSEMPYDSQR